MARNSKYVNPKSFFAECFISDKHSPAAEMKKKRKAKKYANKN